MSPKKTTRKWESFAGRNKFWCDGRLMTSPHNGVFYLTIFLIVSTSALFFAFDCPFLALKITPAIPCIGIILFIFTMSSLLRTSFSDPGIIPRATDDEAAYIEQQIEVPNSVNSMTVRPPPRTREVLIRGQPVKLKYCFTCKFFRPPRASHCSLCDNCVDRFDHHCPWVGNCVGRRNYRYFYMFIVSLAFLAVFIFACAITHIILLTRGPNGSSLLEALRATPASVIESCVCFLSVWSVLGLAGFHTYLTASDQTTNEDIKGSFSTKKGQDNPNPYSRGNVCKNCWHILCGPLGPSLIDRRGFVIAESKSDQFLKEQHIMQQVVVVQPTPERLVGISASEPLPAQYRKHDETQPGPSDAPPVLLNQYRRFGGSYSNIFHTQENQPGFPLKSPQRPIDNRLAMEEQIARDKYMENRLNANVYGNVLMSDAVEVEPAPLYSNLAGASYMNHSLDLDPVILTSSKENLVNVRYMDTAKVTSNLTTDNYSREPNRNVAPSLEHTTASKMAAALNKDHNRNNTGNGSILSASRLKLLQDTTMIDTALDLDSLDGSTISCGTATV